MYTLYRLGSHASIISYKFTGRERCVKINRKKQPVSPFTNYNSALTRPCVDESKGDRKAGSTQRQINSRSGWTLMSRGCSISREARSRILGRVSNYHYPLLCLGDSDIGAGETSLGVTVRFGMPFV